MISIISKKQRFLILAIIFIYFQLTNTEKKNSLCSVYRQ